MLYIFLAILEITAGVQEPRSGCERVNAADPPHALVFERIGEGTPWHEGESTHRVWLRFRNNTTCEVLVQLGEFHRQDGTWAVELSDGEERRLNYHVANSSSRMLFQVTKSDEYVVTRIKPGASVIFDVPQTHFKDNRTVILPIAYVWEGLERLNPSPGSRWIGFSRSMIPETVRKQLKR